MLASSYLTSAAYFFACTSSSPAKLLLVNTQALVALRKASSLPQTNVFLDRRQPVLSPALKAGCFLPISLMGREEPWARAAEQSWGRVAQPYLQRWISSVIRLLNTISQTTEAQEYWKQFLTRCLELFEDVKTRLPPHILIIPCKFRCYQLSVFQTAVPVTQLRKGGKKRLAFQRRHPHCTHIPRIHTPAAKHTVLWRCCSYVDEQTHQLLLIDYTINGILSKEVCIYTYTHTYLKH